jgi:glycosyltransferase involved in cell wall biosynthesis
MIYFMFCSLRDSCGAQLLEAMANGIPIITLDLFGARFLVPDDAGIKVKVKDPEYTINELVQAVNKLYKNQNLRVAMGRKGFEVAKTHMWPVRIGVVNKYYDEILESKGNSTLQ